MSENLAPFHQILEDLVKHARKLGADAADASAYVTQSISCAQRLGKLETLERTEAQNLGLRVFIGKKQAIVSTNDVAPDQLDLLVDRAISMARHVPEDHYCGLADPAQIFQGILPDLQTNDPEQPDHQALIARATQAEEAALAINGVTNSEGAEASWWQGALTRVASNGFTGHQRGSRHSISAAVIAGEGQAMEMEYAYHVEVFAEDLKDPTTIGHLAGTRAVARLDAKKGRTVSVPVVFDPRVASHFAGHLAGAINGHAIASGTSFLKEALGQKIMADGIYLIDDPHRQRGLASHPFDAEGLPTARRHLVEDGILTSWVLDLASARKLGMESTGHASGGMAAAPSPSTTNLYFAPGAVSPQSLIADIDQGFYVTALMGQGVNQTTGDYSRGASGFWIEKGQKTTPVNEMTIAGNLKDMFLDMTLADDLEFNGITNAPTIRIGTMMVAGTPD